MWGAGLSDEEVVEAIDGEGGRCVEAGDVVGVDGAVGAEAGDGVMGGVGDVPVAGGIGDDGGGGGEAVASGDDGLVEVGAAGGIMRRSAVVPELARSSRM